MKSYLCAIKMISKPKRINSNTRGNSSDGTIYHNNKKGKINYTPPVLDISDMEILSELDKTIHCCAYGGSVGCIRKTFSVDTDGVINLDINKSIEIVRLCRRKTNWRSPEELDQFAQTLFRDSIERTIDTKDGIKFVMDYRIENRKYPVCKKSFACAYGVSEYKLETISNRIKECGEGSAPFEVSHKSFSDGTIHDYNYAQTEKLFAVNLCSDCVGEKYLQIKHPWHLIVCIYRPQNGAGRYDP